MMRLFCCALALLMGTLPLALADVTVTACSSDTEGPGVTMAQAMAIGGVIYFGCPGNTVIRVTRQFSLTSPTRLDGGDRVTLDGLGMTGPLFDAQDHRLTLARIAVRNFREARGPLHSVWAASVARGSNLELDSVTVDNSDTSITATSRGTVTITNSTFRGNSGTAVNGGGARTRIDRSNFIDNGEALLLGGGEVTRTSFIGNRSGAVLVSFPGSPVVIRNNKFYQNKGKAALRITQRSGWAGSALVSLRSNTFENNSGEIAGAISIFDPVPDAPSVIQAQLAIMPPSRFESSYDRFRNNTGSTAGAVSADLQNTQGLAIVGALFLGNRSTYSGAAWRSVSPPRSGGSLAVFGGPISISHSLFKGNGVFMGATVWSADAPMAMANSLLVENEGGTGALNAPAVALHNVTIAKNKNGGVMVRDPAAPSRIANSILADNGPSNCSGVPAFAFAGTKNTQWGASDCAGVGSADPDLDAYYIPSMGNFALRAGDPAVCRAVPVGGRDVVFSLRTADPASCALGAYEYPPLRTMRFPRERPQR